MGFIYVVLWVAVLYLPVHLLKKVLKNLSK